MDKKKLKIITEILAIIAIILVSFVGVYKQDGNRTKNQVRDFKFESNLDGYREIILEPSIESDEDLEEDENISENENNEEADEEENDEELDNNEEKTNSFSEEDYKNSKNLIEKRLKLLNVEDYIISQDLSNGNIYLYIPENTETDHIISNLIQTAKLEIKDSEDSSEIFITNDHLKKVSAVYNTTEEGTTVFLQFQFDDEGAKILRDLSSGEYKTKEETDNQEESEDTENAEGEEENTENDEENDTQKKITMSIDDSELITTSFDEVIEKGIINLSMNRASTDDSEIKETLKSAATISSILNSGVMPVSYEISDNKYIQTDITKETIEKICIGIGAAVAVGLIYLVAKYKAKGLLAAISYVGFIALDLLIVRYTNVSISLVSFIGGVIVLVINYLIVWNLLKLYENNDEEPKAGKLLAKEIIRYLPIFIISIVFAFTKIKALSSLGMFMFWGIILGFVYNYIITRDMIKK